MRTKRGLYEPLGTDGFEFCHPVDEHDFERIDLVISGTAQQSSWEPIGMQVFREDQGKNLAASDSPWLGSEALIFRSSVIDSLGSLLKRYGELLPVSCHDANLWMYNPTTVLDALDEASSSIERFDDGSIMMIDHHVFRPSVVADNDIFKISSLSVSPTFVSHRFVDRWKGCGLTGLDFVPVWAAQDS